MSLFAVRWYIDQGLPDEEIAIKLGVTVERIRRLKRNLSVSPDAAGANAEV